ncbi:MAG: hypothetical protein BGO31_07215 [Bacteroidetes bacterium 43-16]|nr:MAG: hypothetical protein BGO31_07215 [Bacteroidetes bacterium 43-16]
MKTQMYLPAVAFMMMTASAMAQTKIKDGSISSTPQPSGNAVLELESNNKGLLLPRVALTALNTAAPLTAHVAGMTVYNTASTADVTPGYYYNNGSQWVRINQPEPWKVQNSSADATANNQDIYQMGKVAINKNTPSDQQLEVVGDVKAHYTNGAYNGGIQTNFTDFGVPMNILYVADNPSLAAATKSSVISLYDGIANLQSNNGLGGGNIAAISSATGGTAGIVSNNSTQTISAEIWTQSNGTSGNVTLSHNKSTGERAAMAIEKLSGITFDFKKTDGTIEGVYTFPRTAGLSNQVLSVQTNAGGTNGTSTLQWKNVNEVIGVLPVYLTDTEADNALPSGALYKISGSRIVRQRP